MPIWFKLKKIFCSVHELETELSCASEPEPLSLDNKWKGIEETVRKVTTNDMDYSRKQAGKEWFDEECEKVKEEKNACRANAIQREQRYVVQNKRMVCTRGYIQQPVYHLRREDDKIAPSWSHTHKTRRPTTEGYFNSKTARNKKD
jgi:hypothetical protein